MMPHPARRRALGVIAVLALALVPAALVWPEDPDRPASSVLAVVLQAALAAAVLAAALAAVRLALPDVRRAVRGVRAWHARRRDQQHAARPAGKATRQQRRAARVLVAVVVAAVLTVTLVAVALNYAHGMDVAGYNREGGWRALLYPVAADGLLISASLVLVWQLLAAGGMTWGPRLAFVVGIAASAGTNVLAALHAQLGGALLLERIVWTTWPTLALLASHEMLLKILAHYARLADVFGTQEPDPELVAAQQERDEARARAEAAQQQALDLVAQVRAEADDAVQQARAESDQVRADADAQLAHLRQEQERRAQEQDQELQRLIAELDAANQRARAQHEEVDQLRRQLAELDEVGVDPEADFDAIRQQLRRWIACQLHSGEEVRTTDIARIFRVSLRWAQKHVPAVLAEAQQHNTEPPRRQLALAATP